MTRYERDDEYDRKRAIELATADWVRPGHRRGGGLMRCPECGRVFDLLDPDDAGEWYYGHDCEVGPGGVPSVDSEQEVQA